MVNRRSPFVEDEAAGHRLPGLDEARFGQRPDVLRDGVPSLNRHDGGESSLGRFSGDLKRSPRDRRQPFGELLDLDRRGWYTSRIRCCRVVRIAGHRHVDTPLWIDANPQLVRPVGDGDLQEIAVLIECAVGRRESGCLQQIEVVLDIRLVSIRTLDQQPRRSQIGHLHDRQPDRRWDTGPTRGSGRGWPESAHWDAADVDRPGSISEFEL
jgi:hypothetical protein